MPFRIGKTVHALITALFLNRGSCPFFQNPSVIVLIQVADMHNGKVVHGSFPIVVRIIHNHFPAVGNISTKLLLKGKLFLPVPAGKIPCLLAGGFPIRAVIAVISQNTVIEKSQPAAVLKRLRDFRKAGGIPPLHGHPYRQIHTVPRCRP